MAAKLLNLGMLCLEAAARQDCSLLHADSTLQIFFCYLPICHTRQPEGSTAAGTVAGRAVATEEVPGGTPAAGQQHYK